MKKRIKKKFEAKKEAPLKIKGFFDKAGKAFKKNPALSNDYIRKARNLAMKFRLKMPRILKRRFCRHCYSFLKPGINCRVRTKAKKVIYYCLNCRKYMRFVIKKNNKNRTNPRAKVRGI